MRAAMESSNEEMLAQRLFRSDRRHRVRIYNECRKGKEGLEAVVTKIGPRVWECEAIDTAKQALKEVVGSAIWANNALLMVPFCMK